MTYIGLYPGTFDPLTYGHLDIIERASQICDKLIIGVADNSHKSPLFSLSERLDMVMAHVETTPGKSHIEVISFACLLTDFARHINARFIVRGLRAVSDFEYEFQMASANRRLKNDLETVFLTASEQQHFVASSLVKEIARFGGDVSTFVSEDVRRRIEKRMEQYNKKTE